MNPKWKRLADQAKKVVDQRGGTDALKRDAEQLKGIAKGRGSFGDKAKAAADALKQPGEAGSRPSKGGEPIADQQAPAVDAARREAQERGERPS